MVQVAQWVAADPAGAADRRALFDEHREHVIAQIARRDQMTRRDQIAKIATWTASLAVNDKKIADHAEPESAPDAGAVGRPG